MSSPVSEASWLGYKISQGSPLATAEQTDLMKLLDFIGSRTHGVSGPVRASSCVIPFHVEDVTQEML